MINRDHSLKIRPLTPEDMEAIFEIYRQCEDFLALGPEPKASMGMVLHDIETSRRDKGVFCGIYIESENLIGIVDYIPADFDGTAHAAFITLLMISAPFRNQGIGTKILDLVEERIRMFGRAMEIQTAVQTNNPEALRFFQGNNYSVFGKPETRPDRTEVLYLGKKLPGRVI